MNVFRNKTGNQPVSAYRDIFEQYITDASFLWVLRSIGVKQPHYSVSDIAELELRIDASLDGLMNSIDLAWELCKESLTFEQAGEAFTAAVIAFRSHDVEKIKTAVSAGLVNDETFKGLTSALGWLPGNLVHGWIQKFLTSKDLNHKYLAISACSVRRENPGEILAQILQREDCLAHTKLRARALRLIGELKIHDLKWALSDTESDTQADDEPEVKFWLNWSRLMLGDSAQIEQLQEYVVQPGALQTIAIETAFRALPVATGRKWISQIAADPEQVRAVIRATGVLGDPHAVPWLIDKMGNAETARLAAEAFSMITGIDLVRYDLSIEVPEDITILPNDNPEDENVDLDEDENLPYPDVNKVAYAWQKHGGKYVAGQRYFMGGAINRQALEEKLTRGLQRQRNAAALALALLETQTLLINTKARSSRQ
ncbi:TIGR02270 family protein [Aliikangiella coralliicola]|uniref:TIGR02270 family protein n=1 Tax=Aliikangiella coralliicola TaxID=2592383 RepID=A0A545U8V4_9GAMM|nr:TIGR02270 family protein [Aliikangiella coralliicola]TQV85895.1 TIGR02270 family protein [Aliikangiella coralliicola]